MATIKTTTKVSNIEITDSERITHIISGTSEGINLGLDLNKTFDTMFSHQGLKGIIEFILSNQDRFAIQLKEHTQTLTK
jgi:hypothetical protein